MLTAALPQAGLAISAEEALFGDGSGMLGAAEDGAVDDGNEADTPEDDEEDETYGATATATVSEYSTLKLGDRDGEDSAAYIVFLQNRLIELGYLRDAADGVFGGNTETAVRAFQKYNDLPETGVADPDTQRKLFSDVSGLVSAPVDSTMFGSETTRIQTMLGQWGFYGGSVDGKMGAGTELAIRRFKAYMREIDPDYGKEFITPTPTPNPQGMFSDMPIVVDEPLEGGEIQDALDSQVDEALMEYIDGDKEFPIYRMSVRNGDKNSDVMRVQTRLHQLKYLYGNDGAFGNLTANALIVFQHKHGLPESGVADEETQRMLFSARAMETEEYVFPYKVVVDVSDQRVYIGGWTGEGYTKLVHTFKCSTGKVGTPTPLGTYQSAGRASGEWYYFKEFNCYAKWATRIVGGVLFHSVTYSSGKRLNGSSVSKLGHRASHGCVRLSVENAKWIYDNCPLGTTIIIQE